MMPCLWRVWDHLAERARPDAPEGAQLHVRWLPDPIDLAPEYVGLDDDGHHLWVARLRGLHLVFGDILDAGGGISVRRMPAKTTLSILFDDEEP